MGAESVWAFFLHWNAGLSAFAFCVFAAYMVLVDDSLRPTKSAAHRMMVGILTGIVIAALNHAPGEGFLLGAMTAAFLVGLLGTAFMSNPLIRVTRSSSPPAPTAPTVGVRGGSTRRLTDRDV